MHPGLEDNFDDVLSKAARGLGLGASELAERAGLSASTVRALLRGEADREALRCVAPVLGLDAESLEGLAEHRWTPPSLEVPGLAAFTEAYPVPGYPEMTVNSYLVWDAEAGEGFAFDAGVTGDPMLEKVEKEGLTLGAILLTHSHRDHVAGLEALRAGAGNPPVYLHGRESLAGVESFREGRVFRAGRLSAESRLTDGHSPGGCTYIVSGLERPVAIVGDSLFCLSQGGASASAFAIALRNNRENILSLPDETVLCPGHGPMTAVAFEKSHNPFFAGVG